MTLVNQRHATLTRALPPPTLRVIGLGLCCIALVGCKNDPEPPAPATAAPLARSADRLSDGEHLPGEETAFGIPVPKGLRVTSRYLKSIYLTGKGSANDLTEYFRTHVLTDHLEIAGRQTIFPRVYIKGDAQKRLYRIEIAALGPQYSKVTIRDITPPPLTPGLTEEQRWEQVGLNPDGTLKDRLQLK